MSAQIHLLTNRMTRCGLQLVRHDAYTWVRWGRGNIILVGDEPTCFRCRDLAGLDDPAITQAAGKGGDQ